MVSLSRIELLALIFYSVKLQLVGSFAQVYNGG